jgi:hypothetical protein
MRRIRNQIRTMLKGVSVTYLWVFFVNKQFRGNPYEESVFI